MPDPNAGLVVNDASELALQVTDLPAGWQVQWQGPSADGFFSIHFVKMGDTSTPREVVIIDIKVQSSLFEAEAEFARYREESAEPISVAGLGLGDEYFFSAGGGQYKVHFVRRNVLARATMLAVNGGSQEKVERWAQKLDEKIDRVKRLSSPYAYYLGATPDKVDDEEWHDMQSAMDSMIADTGNFTVSANLGTSTNDFTKHPIGRPLYDTYLRVPRTEYFYCWDSTGLIARQFDKRLSCATQQ
ncbi:MAG: hypothetical protein IH941_09210 [Acidobacteria bacterium]|nr:hypothetical protein [Acidobacteriota bacterium]